MWQLFNAAADSGHSLLAQLFILANLSRLGLLYRALRQKQDVKVLAVLHGVLLRAVVLECLFCLFFAGQQLSRA